MRRSSLPSFKGRKPYFYIIFGIYVFLVVLILAESAIPGSQSGSQSNWMSQIVANIINWFSDDTPAVVVEPLSVNITEDSSFLGEKKIATGTTTLLTFNIEEPSYVKGETASREFKYEEITGGDHYEVITQSYVSSNNEKFTYARIVAKGEPLENCQVRFYAGTTKDVYCDYTFDIVELTAPVDGGYAISLSDSELNIGESEIVDVTFSYNGKTDDYLRRYWDPAKLIFSSSNEEVATVDEFGMILAKGAGSATISCGNQNLSITVSDTETSIGDELSMTAEGAISENDYDVLGDYVTANKVSTREAANAINSGIILTASIDGQEDSGAAYSWEVVDEDGNRDYLGGKIVALNENGSRARLMGYRRGPDETVNVKCTVKKVDGSELIITDSFVVSEITPATMEIIGNQSTLTDSCENGSTISLSGYFTSKQLTLEGSFLGANSNTNVTNKKIVVSDYDEDAFTVAGNSSTAVTLTFMEKGTHTIKVSSAGNPDLYYVLSFTVEETPNVDPNSSAFQTFIRKFLGHASLFMVTGIFGFLFFAFYWGEEKKLYLTAICSSVIGLATGGFSELIQLFTPDRGPSWSDVGIDFIGYTIGTLLLFLIFFLIRYFKAKKGKGKEDDQG